MRPLRVPARSARRSAQHSRVPSRLPGRVGEARSPHRGSRGQERDGWIGPPLVVDGEQALTGAPRYDGAQAAEVAVPRVQASDLAAAFGID